MNPTLLPLALRPSTPGRALVAVAGLTAIPARLGARRPAAVILESELA